MNMYLCSGPDSICFSIAIECILSDNDGLTMEMIYNCPNVKTITFTSFTVIFILWMEMIYNCPNVKTITFTSFTVIFILWNLFALCIIRFIL